MPPGSENIPAKDKYGQAELPLFEDSPAPQVAPASSGTNAGIFLQFSGWDRSVLDLITENLTASWNGGDTLDLSDRLVLVPTRNAGRMLRERLALHASKFKAAVVPPLVTSPDFLHAPDRLETTQGNLPVASSRDSLLIWSSLLLDLPLKKYRNIFPIDPVERDLNWSIGTARDLLHIRNLLAESNHDFTSASQVLADNGMEPLRWKELARLEKEAIQFTEERGFQDEYMARNPAIEKGNLPLQIRQITVAAIPDLSHQAASALLRHSRNLPIEVIVHAPEDIADHFDDWGRPTPGRWLDKKITIPNAEQVIHQAANAGEQALLVNRLLENQSNPAAISAIGIPDPEVATPVAEVLAANGWTSHDPSGQTVSTHGIFYLLQQTGRLLTEESFAAFQLLLRCPDFSTALVSSLNETAEASINASTLLKHFDKLADRCLPDRLHDARSSARRCFPKIPGLSGSLDWAIQWISRFKKEPFEKVLIEYLSFIFANRIFDKNDKTKSDFTDVASAILQILEDFSEHGKTFRQALSGPEKLELLLELLGETKIYAERTARDIDLQGWLELPWDDAPHLIVTGFNDHLIPESIVGHAFLPDSAREQLGIQTNDSRFARDAFLLTGMIESRRHHEGRVDLIFGRQSNSGDPLRPSRMLFQCTDEELPARILRFFNGESPQHQPHPWKLPWKLQVPPLPEEHQIYQSISVTAFKTYLDCPFRFYLKHGLQMGDLQIGKTEMDAMEFGTLIHNVLDDFGKDPTASESIDEKEIADFFLHSLDAKLTGIYGPRLTTPVMIQLESARQRLRWWAKLEAGQRREGWTIEEVESNIGSKDDPFSLSGTEIRGRIDRIERHAQYGYRIIDFKTGSLKGKPVSSFHQTTIKPGDAPDQFPEWSLVTNEKGKACRWSDLQIPLYVLAMKQRYPDQAVTAGYINLGPTETEILINLWEDLDEDTLASAKNCAEHVILAVQKEHRFWPPNEKVTYDDFEEILFGNALESVAAI